MKQYKKWLVLMFVMMLSFSLSACGGKAPAEGANASSVSHNKESVAVNSSSGQTTNHLSVQGQQGNTMAESDRNASQRKGDKTMITLTVNGTALTAELANNSSAEALKELLTNGPLTVEMSDYASMEKCGSLGRRLPTNDEEITTEAGDLILYQGNQLVIYYAPNSWNFTRLGKIKNVTASELKKILGTGDVKVTLTAAK